MKPIAQNLAQLHQLIEQFPFATLLSQVKGELMISHIPILLDRSQGSQGTLAWHLAKQNPQCQGLSESQNTLCLFQGPHAYISPSWYANHPSVPTWNYAVVHAQGTPREISYQELEQDLDRLHQRYEEHPQTHTPQEHKLRLMDHIVGFRMEILSLEGRFKLGQQRSQEDQAGMLTGLERQEDSGSLDLAKFIRSLHLEPQLTASPLKEDQS